MNQKYLRVCLCVTAKAELHLQNYSLSLFCSKSMTAGHVDVMLPSMMHQTMVDALFSCANKMQTFIMTGSMIELSLLKYLEPALGFFIATVTLTVKHSSSHPEIMPHRYFGEDQETQ